MAWIFFFVFSVVAGNNFKLQIIYGVKFYQWKRVRRRGAALDRVFTEIYSELQTWCLHSFFRLVAMQGISAGFINKTEDFVTS